MPAATVVASGRRRTPPLHPAPLGPDSFRARSVSPRLTVRSVELSLAWYRDVLRFRLDRRHEREGRLLGATLSAGDVRVLLVQDDGPKRRGPVQGVPVRLHLSTTQDVDALAADVRQRGGMLTADAQVAEGRAFSIVDPDGITLTISQASE